MTDKNSDAIMKDIMDSIDKADKNKLTEIEVYFNKYIPHINLLIVNAIKSYIKDQEPYPILELTYEEPINLIKKHLKSVGVDYEIYDNGHDAIPKYTIYFMGMDDKAATSHEHITQISDMYRLMKDVNDSTYGFDVNINEAFKVSIYECFCEYKTIEFTGDLRDYIKKKEEQEAARVKSEQVHKTIEENKLKKKNIVRKPVEQQKMSKGAKLVLAALVISGFIMAITNS